MECPHCHSREVKKNGHTPTGKQNFQCKVCLRQFLEFGQDWFVSESERELIDKLLLERISLRGICRVCGVGLTWLLAYIKTKYEVLPDDLNADIELPDTEAYLADRLDEEFRRLSLRKKGGAELENHLKVPDNEEIDAGINGELSEYSDLETSIENDLLIDELYGEERANRVEYVGIQLDEMWTFFQKKENKQWLWLALNPVNR